MKRLLNIVLLVGIIAGFGACTAREAKAVEGVEATTAEIEAAQMQGRNAAREFVSREWNDSLELHKHLLNVAAKRSEYTKENRIEERNAFDSTFISTVRTVRPGLAQEIERTRPRE